jgi:AcrR family transcriptional regulator
MDGAQKMIATTRELIYEHGIASAQTRAIARACHQSSAAPSYYFGTKARLLGEVLRADSNQRLDVLRATLTPANSYDELVQAAARTMAAFLQERRMRGTHELMAEITRLSLENRELADVRARIRRNYRDSLARLLRDKERADIVRLPADPTVVAALLIALAQGLAVEATADPGWDHAETVEMTVIPIRALLGGPADSNRR